MWLHAGQVRLYWPFGLLEYSSVNSSVVSVTFRHLHHTSQVHLSTIRSEGKHALGQLGYCAWLKVGGRADGNKVLAFAITNPLDGLIP
jgi:hypothetical protein|tara:strand:- start:1209 stop:1472 length:264 start_codon:yes stop_codon:yes gene_type:complete